MTQLKIDPEFRDKIPPLSDDEFSKLEENIVADGEVREPLVVWNDTIIDGHHRWKIIQKHPGIPFKFKAMDFADKWAAIAWMCRNQLGRRNLSLEDKEYLIGKQYEAERLTDGNPHKERNEKGHFVHLDQFGQDGVSTRKRIANETKTSEGYVQRAEQFAKGLDQADAISPGFRKAVLSGDIVPTRAVIREIPKLPDEKKEKIVEAIKSGDAETAKQIARTSKPYKPIANATPIDPRPPYNLDDFRDELQDNIDNMESCLKQTLVIAHREMLYTDEGCDVASAVLQTAHHTIKRYEEMILRIRGMRNSEIG